MKIFSRRSYDHPVVKEFVTGKIELIEKYIDIDENTTVLDLGCGAGFFSAYFEEICKVKGIDSSIEMLKMNPVKDVFLMDALNLGFKNNTFDVVFCCAVLHHVEEDDKVLKEMNRVSKKYIIILEPNRNNPFMFLFNLIKKDERRALKFSLNYLRRKVKRSGLHIITSFSCGMLVPNRCPTFLLPIVKIFKFNQPLGMTNFIIAEKKMRRNTITLCA